MLLQRDALSVHAPLRQPCVGEHCVLQLPQYKSLVMTLAQTPLQLISPPPHIMLDGLSGTYVSGVPASGTLTTSPQAQANRATATTKLRIPQSYGQTGFEIEW